MRISDWSSDVCSSDLGVDRGLERATLESGHRARAAARALGEDAQAAAGAQQLGRLAHEAQRGAAVAAVDEHHSHRPGIPAHERHLRHLLLRSEAHTSELQSLMRTSYAVFCLKQNKSQ